MAESGDGTDPGAAVEQLRRQVEQMGRRLNDLEKVTLPALKRKVSEHERKWADDKQGQQEASRQTKLARQRIADLDAVLASALAARPLAFGDLKAGQGPPAPERARYQAPRKLRHRLPGGTERFERDRQDAQRRYQRDYDSYALQAQQAAERNAAVEVQEAAFAEGDRAAVEWFTGEVLRHSDYPAGVPRDYQVSYQPGQACVAVILELPPPQSVPQEDGFLHQPPGGVCPVRRPEAAVRQQYKRLIACIALRAVHEIFSATSPHPAVVREVTVSGWCTGQEEAAGESRTARLVSLTAERGLFTGLNLKDVQPVECLTLTLGGQMSPYPFGLVPLEHADPPR
jgi:restriction system protein